MKNLQVVLGKERTQRGSRKETICKEDVNTIASGTKGTYSFICIVVAVLEAASNGEKVEDSGAAPPESSRPPAFLRRGVVEARREGDALT